MKIIKLYEEIIDFCGLYRDDDKIFLDERDRDPLLVNGKQLVIPTNSILRNFDARSMIVFHPLSEDIIKDESDTINKLRYIINVKLNIAIGVLAQNLLNIVNSPELHGKLTPEQSEIIYHIRELDDKTIKAFTTYMMKEVNDKEDRLFSYIYLKKGGTVKGERFARSAIVTFPFFQQFSKNPKDDKGRFRPKDVAAYLEVFRFMFPDLETPEEYNIGSNSSAAPFFEALMLGSYRLAERINKLLTIYTNYIDDAESLMFNLDWIDLLKQAEGLKNEIRSIPTATILEAPVPQAPMQPQQPVYQQPPQPSFMPAPVVDNTIKETSRGLDFNSLKQKMGMGHMPNAFGNQFGGPRMMPGMQSGYPAPAPYTGDILNRPQMAPMPMQPNMGYPNMQPNMGYPQQPMQPNMGYPNMQPNMGYPQQPMQPNMGYPNMQPNMGYPQQSMQPNMGFPNMQPNMGYPNR